MKGRLSRLLVITAAAVVLLGASARAEAKDLLDYVIEAVDPTLAPARPLVECMAGGGGALDCAQQVAKAQGKAALTIGPEDDRVKKVVAVFMAVRDERWGEAVKIGGQVVAKTVACAIIPVQGPAKGTACNIIGWVIAHNVGTLDKAYQALKGPDWWALVGLLGSAACDLMPDDGAAGAAKLVLCGALANVLAGAKQFADEVAKTAVAGSDALENLIFGDDSHMPYDRYYALRWQPWYHYGVDRLLYGGSLKSLAASIYGPCVSYFDSHNQYKSTAKKTCSDMRDKRFLPELQAFAAALPVAVEGYFESVVRPAVRVAVLLSYGKKLTGELPGKKLFQGNCDFQMRGRFPFPEPNDAVCKAIAAKGVENPMFKTQFMALAKACYADHHMQVPDPTVWAHACKAVGPLYDKAFASEGMWLIGTIGRLKKKGCKTPTADEAKKSGLLFKCTGTAAYSACLTELGKSGSKYCRIAIPVAKLSDQQSGQAKAGAKQPVVPSSGAGSRTRSSARAGATVNLEAEALLASGKVVAGRSTAAAQGMSAFGTGWSGGSQLFWTPQAAGESLALLFDVREAGTYALEIHLTHAPDYGLLDIQVDSQRSTLRHDGYAARVTGPLAVPLGRFSFEPGQHRITLRIAGRSRSSSGILAGIDRIRLTR